MIHSLKFLFSFVSILLISVFLHANENIIESKIVYGKYLNVPKVVYSKQKFKVDISIKILLPKTQTFSISTDIKKNININRITEDIIWYKKDNNTFETTIEYKIYDKSFKLPKINISILDVNNAILDSVVLKKPSITYRKIAIKQKNYSNVIATKFEINSVRTKQYTNNKLLSLIQISAKNSNLEDFKLSLYNSQGIKDISLKEDTQILYYYVIIPSHTKYINFEYYNSKLNEFVKISLPVIMEEELVSTQTDLNPFENSILIYKKIALAIVVFIFLIIYFFTKKGRYLFIAIIFMTFLIFLMKPNEKITIKKDTKVYILPTLNSIVYKIISNDEEVSVLQKKEKFTKVLFKNKNLGWIKNE